MKKYSILLLLFLSVSQSKSSGTYPLQIGNQWDYGEPSGPVQWAYYYSLRIVDDTLMPNGKTYFVESSNKDGRSSKRYLRQEGSIVYSYSSPDEIILYDFSRQNGDTINIKHSSDDTIVTTLQIGSSLVFGREHQTWGYFTKSSVTTMYSIVSIADSIGYIGSHGEVFGYGLMGAIINGKEYGIITSVMNLPTKNPTVFELKQNYPNPFNPSTTIKIFVGNRTEAVLRVFNALGQEIDVLYEGELEAGNHTFRWNAEKLSGGIYFCRVDANNISETLKLIFLK